jgi:hypothetical protein
LSFRIIGSWVGSAPTALPSCVKAMLLRCHCELICPTGKSKAGQANHLSSPDSGRWVWDAVDAAVSRDERTDADGEGVWSWRPDAGAKVVE